MLREIMRALYCYAIPAPAHADGRCFSKTARRAAGCSASGGTHGTPLRARGRALAETYRAQAVVLELAVAPARRGDRVGPRRYHCPSRAPWCRGRIGRMLAYQTYRARERSNRGDLFI